MEQIAEFFRQEQVAGNLISGLIASVFTWAVITARAWLRRWRACSRFVGRYEVATVKGRKVSDEAITIRWLGGMVIQANSVGSTERWRSTITLDPQIPYVGRGYYQYEDHSRFGLHNIQMTSNGRDIFVHLEGPRDGGASHGLIWRRVA